MQNQTSAGIDYSQYKSWPKVVAPNGAVYYKVPNTGYLYDPFLSQSKGRPVLFNDPSPQVAERQKAEEERQAAIDAQKRAMSPAGQILPVVGSVGGIVGAKYAVDALSPVHAIGSPVNTPNGLVMGMSDGSFIGPGAQGQSAAAGALTAQTPGQAFANAATAQAPGVVAPGVAPSWGGALDATMAQNGIGPVASGAEYGNMLANSTSGIGPFASGENYASALSQAPAEEVGALGSAAPYLGVAGAALGGYGLYNAIQANDPKSAFISGAGLGSGLAAAAPLLGLGPVGWAGLGLAALGGGAFGLGAEGLLGHKKTKQYEAERWGGLADDGVADANAAFQANHPEGDTGKWTSGKFAGKEWNFEDASTLAKEDPSQFRLVYGNYQTFGNDWSKYSPAQQDQIVSRLLSEGLYKPDHGDIIIKNEEAARKIKDEVLGGSQTTTAISPEVATKTQGQTTKAPVITGPINIATQNPNVNAPVGVVAPNQWRPQIQLPSNVKPFPIVINNPPSGGAAIVGKQLAQRLNARR